MSIHLIGRSLTAIQACDTKANVYLKVVGKGDYQQLEVVKMNWFGRLLMWLGCGNASMKKVARYVADHIDSLCKYANEADKASLSTLVKRIEKYDDRHNHKIYSLVLKIKQAIWDKFIVMPVVPPKAFPAMMSAVPMAVNTLPPLASPTGVSSPNPVIPPSVSMVPIKSKLHSVIEFEKCRNDRRAVYDLLGKYGHDEGQFKALMEAMTPQEIYSYSPAQQTEINDFFDLTADAQPRIKPGFVVKFMNLQQLQELIRGHFIKSWENGICDSFFSIIKSILVHRSQDEQTILVDQIVQLEIFTLDFMTSKSTPVQLILKERYLLRLLRSTPEAARSIKLQEFFAKVWANNFSLTNKFLLDPNFVNLLSLKEKGEIVLSIIPEYDLPSWEKFSFLQEVINDPILAPPVFNRIKTRHKCDYLLELCKNFDSIKNSVKTIHDDSSKAIHEKFLGMLLEIRPIPDDLINEIINKIIAYYKLQGTSRWLLTIWEFRLI